jgi:hypothetical protein
VPTVCADGTTELRCWGKLSIDDGRDSDRLGVRDVANIALFGKIAGAAIAMVAARVTSERHLELFRKYSQRMVATVWQPPTQDVKASVVELLLELYLELTGADVAFFRQFRAGALCLQGEARWRSPAPAELRVPTEMRRGEGGSASVLNWVDREGRLLDSKAMLPPVIYETQPRLREAIARIPVERWDGKELTFLQKIGSQFCIPLVVHSTLRGVIVAATWDPGGLAAKSQLALRRFIYTAPVWYAFAELLDSRSWSAKTLGDMISVLPELARAETDERLYAGLAAILSVHCGVGWNRVLVFDCQGPVPNVAQLVYALGGIGRPDHLVVIDRVKRDISNLGDLVRMRLEDPAPHGWDPTSQGDQTDLLYASYVQYDAPSAASEVAGSTPVRIRFGANASSETERWLKHVLLDTHRADHDTLAVPWSPEELGFQELRGQYPGLLCDTRAYLFPIWEAFNSTPQRPLAFVVLDNPYRTDHPTEEMLLVTRALLDLVGDIMTSRNNERTISGCIGALPTFAHHTGLKDRWDTLYPELDQLLIRLREVGPTTGIAAAGQICRLQGLLDAVRTRVERVCEDQKILRDRLVGRRLSGRAPTIPDLGQQLDRIANAWERNTPGLTIDRLWPHAYGVALSCDPYPFEGVLRCLLDNAVTASRELRPNSLSVSVSVDFEPWPGDSSRRFAVIRVRDMGEGIPVEAQKYLFVEDFTFRKGQPVISSSSNMLIAPHTGLGLSIARTLASACHGDLQVEAFGRPADPATGRSPVGATFAFCVCVSQTT